MSTDVWPDQRSGRYEVGDAQASASPKIPADPAALGLGGFALTTFVLSVINTGLVSKSAEPVMFGLALTYGGIAQLLAGMWEFRAGNTFGAVVFSSYGAFWLSFWAFVQFYAAIPIKEAGDAVGLYLFGWAIFTVLMWVASLRTNTVLVGIFTLLVPTFLLLALGNTGANDSLVKASGWLGLAVAAGAWYLALVHVTSATFKRDVLPVGPLRGHS